MMTTTSERRVNVADLFRWPRSCSTPRSLVSLSAHPLGVVGHALDRMNIEIEPRSLGVIHKRA